ncbi:MAG: hypothetical protein V1871_02650 [Planctomycetota bacterium]
MNLSDIRKKRKQLEDAKKKTLSAAVSSPAKAIKHDPKYPRKVALALVIFHVIFAISITIWHLHIYILKPNSFGCIVYLLELPGAIILKILGQNQNIESVIIYIIAFFINTVFYGFLGYFLGRIFQKYGWDKEIRTLCKLETEVYEKEIEPEEI